MGLIFPRDSVTGLESFQPLKLVGLASDVCETSLKVMAMVLLFATAVVVECVFIGCGCDGYGFIIC